MARLLLLTSDPPHSDEVLPALSMLGHVVRALPADASLVVGLDDASIDAILVDARQALPQARTLCRLLHSTGVPCAVIAVLTEGGIAALNAEWEVDDVLLDSAGPAEIAARLRLAIERSPAAEDAAQSAERITAGELTIDEHSYSARLGSRTLNLTYKEFELLKHLAQHPGRVFTRTQLLQEVWGYDYYGGTRTVDVHVRRLRAKLGSEHEQLIGTTRGVGYQFVAHREDVGEDDSADHPAPDVKDIA